MKPETRCEVMPKDNVKICGIDFEVGRNAVWKFIRMVI